MAVYGVQRQPLFSAHYGPRGGRAAADPGLLQRQPPGLSGRCEGREREGKGGEAEKCAPNSSHLCGEDYLTVQTYKGGI